MGIPCGSVVKNLPAMQETWETQVWFLGWEDPLEKGMATHSSVLAWRIPMDRGVWWATVHGGGRVGHNWAKSTFSTHQISLPFRGHNVGVQRIMGMRIQYSHRWHLKGRYNQSTENLLDSTCLLPKITSMLSDRCEGCKYNPSWIKP